MLITNFPLLFDAKIIFDVWNVILTDAFSDPSIFYAISTTIFSFLFLLIFAYYRIREGLTDYPNIIRIKRNFQSIAKDRLKQYLLQSAQFYN
ncbi:hypothetical protein X943_000029 [Babesia divergens]|uniref:Uncharacterized protein n=1 Tax=Babesia divergens TaxID=32595 RepID=A0AAD9GC79_BABDI|nr:hypothetical protein X943_000029 [Babesia divergens]